MKPFRLLASACCLCLVFSCQSNSSNDKEYLERLTDSTSITGLTGDSVKLVKTASINFKVKNVEQSIRSVSALAQKYDGMLTYQNMDAAEERRAELRLSADSLLVVSTTTPRAEITARIPSQNLEAFLFGVSDLGYYTGNSRLQVDDRSLAYLENVLKQKSRTETLAQLSVKKKKAVALTETIAVKDEAIEQQMANRTIDADVAYSTVSLALFQNPVIRKEVVADTYIDNYRLPFWQRLSNAVAYGWEAFLSFVIALAHLWMFLLVGIAVLILYRQWWQKRKPVL